MLTITQAQAAELPQGEGHPRHRLLLPRFNRLASLQERGAQEARREEGQDRPAGPPRMGSAARIQRHPQVGLCSAYPGQLRA